MSKRIDEILEVVEHVFSNHEKSELYSIDSLRLNAVKQVAKRRNILVSTVASRFIRELLPEIKGTEEFDKHLYKWLENGCEELQAILLKHSVNKDDKVNINNFFISRKNISTESDKKNIKYMLSITSENKYLDEINSSFNILGEAIKKYIHNLNQKGAESFEKGSYDKVEIIRSKASQLITYQQKMEEIRTEFSKIILKN